MPKTLVIVANRSRARILSFGDHRIQLQAEHEFVFPIAEKARDTGVEVQSTDKFIKQIADYVEKRRTQGDFGYLILAGDPKFIGNLRQNLSEKCRQMTLSLLPKDVVRENKGQLRRRMSDLLQQHPQMFVGR